MKISLEQSFVIPKEELSDIVPEFSSEFKRKSSETPHIEGDITLTRFSSRIKNYHTFKGHNIRLSLIPTPPDYKETPWWIVPTGIDLFKYVMEDSYSDEDRIALEIPLCAYIREYREVYEMTFPMMTREGERGTPILIQNLYREMSYKERGSERSLDRVPSTLIHLICVAPLPHEKFTVHLIANYLRTFATAFKAARLHGAEKIGIASWDSESILSVIQIVAARAAKIDLRYCHSDKAVIRRAFQMAKTILPDNEEIKFSAIVDSILESSQNVIS